MHLFALDEGLFKLKQKQKHIEHYQKPLQLTLYQTETTFAYYFIT